MVNSFVQFFEDAPKGFLKDFWSELEDREMIDEGMKIEFVKELKG